MDLILWRHADAAEGRDDAARALTPLGLEQASRVAAWLNARLPGNARVLVSPAIRAQQTAGALGRPFETVAAIAPGAAADAILHAAGWPHAGGTAVVVGHQPTIGAAAALALTGRPAHWRVRRCGVWWLSLRQGDASPLVLAVLSPDVL